MIVDHAVGRFRTFLFWRVGNRDKTEVDAKDLINVARGEMLGVVGEVLLKIALDFRCQIDLKWNAVRFAPG